MQKGCRQICQKIMLFLIDVVGVSATTNRVLKEMRNFILALLLVVIGSVNF